MNAIPGATAHLGWKNIIQVFGTKSVKPTSLLAPVRDSALEVYEDLNKAIAKFVFLRM